VLLLILDFGLLIEVALNQQSAIKNQKSKIAPAKAD